jgi:hypothetical protein
VLSDGEVSNTKRQLSLVPYYAIHFLFRSLSMATFWIYWRVSKQVLYRTATLQEWAIFTFFLPVFFNMKLTRQTYDNDK